jgi:hypothetical protein
MAARAGAAALAALALIVPSPSRAGCSARFAVALRVVKPLLARTPSVTLRPEAGAAGARRVPGGTVREVGLELGPAAPAALLAPPGAPARPCRGSCRVPVFVPDGAPAVPVVVTFLPDGAPTGIVER